MERIEVRLAPDGTVQIHVLGVAGLACLDLTQELIAALGGQIDQQGYTFDAYERSAEADHWEALPKEHDHV